MTCLKRGCGWFYREKHDIVCLIMSDYDNGGAYAIKGFNYQKSIVALIAVLHYLDDDDQFEIYVESKDDIVVKAKNIETYIQVKSSELSLNSITRRDKNKNTVIGKNLSNGDEQSRYKLVAPSFKDKEKHLEDTKPNVITKGASVFSYNKDAFDEIMKRMPELHSEKVKNSSVAITAYKAEMIEAVRYLTAIMVEDGIPVDNGYGNAVIEELYVEIDQKSAKIVKSDEDYEFKKFTHQNLSLIISHSYKIECFEEIMQKLGYNLTKKERMKKKKLNIPVQYSSYHEEAKRHIQSYDLENMPEAEVVKKALEDTNFDSITDRSFMEVIVVDAFSQILFEEKQS